MKMNVLKIRPLLAALLLGVIGVRAETPSPRLRLPLDDNWKFSLANPANAPAVDCSEAGWRAVTLPHDWSIEGKIEKTNPTGGAGGFFPAGLGWYRLHVDAPAAWADKRVQVEFEGVYMNADVYCNGKHLATHPYGYTAFTVDLTPALKFGGANVLAVRVDNSQQKNSRWYSGSGIYRHVWLNVTDPVHVSPWGVFVATPRADEQSAAVTVRTKVSNETSNTMAATLQTAIVAPDGSEVVRLREIRCDLPPGISPEIVQEQELKQPALWSPERPQLSRVVTRILVGGRLRDEVSTTFGVRALAWSAERGLQVNGRTVKLCGGCIHHDNGVLGACAFDRAEERRVQFLKAAGFNAIRTAHNPPSPAFLDACDRLGVLVLDETFDCWELGKNKCDYSVFFKDWWTRDVDAMVLRDRNHPSIVMWSIGNEIPQQYSSRGTEIGTQLAGRIRQFDTTRPVAEAFSSRAKTPAAMETWNKLCAALDVVGYNYSIGRAGLADHGKFPERVMVATETYPREMFGIWSLTQNHNFILGDFVWTALDYFGENGIGRWEWDASGAPKHLFHGDDRLWPWFGAECGDVDISGWVKASGHYRNIVWDRGEKLFVAVRQPKPAGKKVWVQPWGMYPMEPSWTWPGFDGQPVEVEVYSRYDAVRLYLNGQPVGKEESTTRKQAFCTKFSVPFAPGTLKAVGIKDGKEAETFTLATAGVPAAIRLTPDRTAIKADGQDLSFVQVEVIDSEGRLQPNADQQIDFKISGPGTIAGLGNGSLRDIETFQGTRCRVFHGRAQVVLRSTRQAGALKLTANGSGLAGVEIAVQQK